MPQGAAPSTPLAMLVKALRVAPRPFGVPTAGFDCAAFRGRLVAVGTKGVPTINPNASGAGRTKGLTVIRWLRRTVLML